MKVYKSNLAGLLEARVGPVYLHQGRHISGSSIFWCKIEVVAACLDSAGNVCELFISTPKVPCQFEDQVAKAESEARATMKDLRERLSALDIPMHDGRFSEQPVEGILD